MADNIATTPGSGATIAADDVGGILHQRVKLSVGADGSATDVRPPSQDGMDSTWSLPAAGLVWNGSTWDRLRDSESVADTGSDAGFLAQTPRLYNGATFDRQRGNLEGTLLASAARTTTANSANQTNYNHRGVLLILNATVAGTGTLTIQLNGETNGIQYMVCIGTTTLSAATGTIALVAYPGILDADTTADARSVVLPRTWIALVNKSDGSSWTYSLGYSLIL